MQSPSRKKYKIKYFSSLSEDEDNEADEDTKINENIEINDDTETDDDAEINDDTKTDDDAETNDDTETIEDADNDKIKSAISALDRPIRNVIARKVSRKSLPYYIK